MPSPIRTRRRALAVLAMLAGLMLPGAPAHAAFSDVPSSHWAARSITHVAETNTWMRAYADGSFRPGALVQRRHVARALVLAFGAPTATESTLTFSDLPPTDPFYRFAAPAVRLGWLSRYGTEFRGTAPVEKRHLEKALVLALGLRAEAAGLNAIKTESGYAFKRSSYLGYAVLARHLQLTFNHPTTADAQEVLPTGSVTRADAAFALSQAVKSVGGWRMQAAEKYRSVVLPDLGAARVKMVEFALRYAGYPYVWAGEWHRPTASGYCCGAQAQGGFDCSGFTWWVLRAPDAGYDNTAIRGYTGWALPERASRDMAAAAKVRLSFGAVAPGDLMFFDTDGAGTDWQAVDHVGVALGNGWMIHSSGSRDGVTIDWIGDGWWRDHFSWGRRIIS